LQKRLTKCNPVAHTNLPCCARCAIAVQIPLGLFILLDPYYNRNAIWARDDFSTLVMAISAGYFLYDTLECMYRIQHEGWDFLLHGVFCLMVYGFLTHTGYLHFYGEHGLCFNCLLACLLAGF
jgi:hypothetical protein